MGVRRKGDHHRVDGVKQLLRAVEPSRTPLARDLAGRFGVAVEDADQLSAGQR